ncbi:MAG: HAD family phosphatase [Acidobacteria bacterium]|nr:HAD family phosphatase [Acidobacteriota bacterium]
MLRAIIFDFDGIIVDSEGLIYNLTREMAAQEGWTVTEEEYYRDYLALDDRGLVEHLFQTHGKPLNLERRDELVEWKFRAYQKLIKEGLPPIPGAVEFVRNVAKRYPLAIASGSLRIEIEHLLAKMDLRSCFQVLATADDCQRSKPDTEVYFVALAKLNALPDFAPKPLESSECLAIEDAPLGVVAAQGAGIRCLALTHSRPAEKLRHADWIFKDFDAVDLEALSKAF